MKWLLYFIVSLSGIEVEAMASDATADVKVRSEERHNPLRAGAGIVTTQSKKKDLNALLHAVDDDLALIAVQPFLGLSTVIIKTVKHDSPVLGVVFAQNNTFAMIQKSHEIAENSLDNNKAWLKVKSEKPHIPADEDHDPAYSLSKIMRSEGGSILTVLNSAHHDETYCLACLHTLQAQGKYHDEVLLNGIDEMTAADYHNDIFAFASQREGNFCFVINERNKDASEWQQRAWPSTARVATIAIDKTHGVKRIAVGRLDGTIKIFESAGKGEWDLVSPRFFKRNCYAIGMNCMNNRINIAFTDGSGAVLKRNAKEQWEFKVFQYDKQPISAIAFDQDRAILARIPNARTGKGSMSIVTHDKNGLPHCSFETEFPSNVNAVAINGDYATVGLHDGTQHTMYFPILSVIQCSFLHDLAEIRKLEPKGIIVLTPEQEKLFKTLPLQSRLSTKKAYGLTTAKVLETIKKKCSDLKKKNEATSCSIQ